VCSNGCHRTLFLKSAESSHRLAPLPLPVSPLPKEAWHPSPSPSPCPPPHKNRSPSFPSPLSPIHPFSCFPAPSPAGPAQKHSNAKRVLFGIVGSNCLVPLQVTRVEVHEVFAIMPLAKPGLAVEQPDGTYGYAPTAPRAETPLQQGGFEPPMQQAGHVYPAGYAPLGNDVEAGANGSATH